MSHHRQSRKPLGPKNRGRVVLEVLEHASEIFPPTILYSIVSYLWSLYCIIFFPASSYFVIACNLLLFLRQLFEFCTFIHCFLAFITGLYDLIFQEPKIPVTGPPGQACIFDKEFAYQQYWILDILGFPSKAKINCCLTFQVAFIIGFRIQEEQQDLDSYTFHDLLSLHDNFLKLLLLLKCHATREVHLNKKGKRGII